MARPVPKEAMDAEDFERWQKDLPPRKKEVPVIPDPEFPKVENMLSLDKIKLENISTVLEGRRKGIRNKEGVMFIGFNVTLKMKDESFKDDKGNVKTKAGETISGWMTAGDFHKFRRILSTGGKVAMNNVEF